MRTRTRFFGRWKGFRRNLLVASLTAAVTAAATLGVQAFAANGETVQGHKFILVDALWTTAHIREKGVLQALDTGLVVTYITPTGRVPANNKDWIGIYEKGQLDTGHRIDWDWVCRSAERCTSHGSAAIPAGDDGMLPGKMYTVAYWADGAKESDGPPVATIDYVVPWSGIAPPVHDEG
ncbi:hypothetical protein ACH4TP_31380 [Streptomyces sp. NPDC021012]|uniref:hypothetical protein n=1 Tax=Streptomyces sp. NPDC021012 TaxID=3365107 RepID=UPI0037BCA70D